MVIFGYRVWPLLKHTAHEISDDNISSLAASATYHFCFSIFSLMLFVAPLVSLLGDRRRIVEWLVAQVTSTLPVRQVQPVAQIIESVVFARNAPTLVSTGAVLAIWSGSNIFGTMMGALNAAYEVRETRPWIKRQLIRLVTFVLGGLVVLMSTIVFLDGESVVAWIGRTIGAGNAAVFLWQVIQFPVAALGLVALAFVALYLLPNVKQDGGHVLFASTLTAVLWIAATLLFRLYIELWPPNQAYGLVGAAIVLLTWMYYTMFIVLVCGELASEIRNGTGRVAGPRSA